MVEYKKKDSFDYDSKTGEVVFSKHTFEFVRFFTNHKKLCDEIAGIKYHHAIINKKSEQFLITRYNFLYGIQVLCSFLVDNRHYIKDRVKKEVLMESYYKLEDDYINDTQYQSYVIKGNDLSLTQEIDFNKKYLKYVLRTFEIGNVISQYLQKSLNIASREITKNVQYVDYDAFFKNLAMYKDEMSHDLSNVQYKNLYEHYKKILGFYYTYRYLVTRKYQNDINSMFKLLYNYLINDDTIRAIFKLKRDSDFTISFKKSISTDLRKIRNVFNLIYEMINESLSSKNILPKISNDIMIDSTLI